MFAAAKSQYLQRAGGPNAPVSTTSSATISVPSSYSAARAGRNVTSAAPATQEASSSGASLKESQPLFSLASAGHRHTADLTTTQNATSYIMFTNSSSGNVATKPSVTAACGANTSVSWRSGISSCPSSTVTTSSTASSYGEYVSPFLKDKKLSAVVTTSHVRPAPMTSLYTSAAKSGPVASQHPVTAVNTSHTEGHPFRSPLVSSDQHRPAKSVVNSWDNERAMAKSILEKLAEARERKLQSERPSADRSWPVSANIAPVTLSAASSKMTATSHTGTASVTSSYTPTMKSTLVTDCRPVAAVTASHTEGQAFRSPHLPPEQQHAAKNAENDRTMVNSVLDKIGEAAERKLQDKPVSYSAGHSVGSRSSAYVAPLRSSSGNSKMTDDSHTATAPMFTRVKLTPVTSQHTVTGVTTSQTEGQPFRSLLKSPEQNRSAANVVSSSENDRAMVNSILERLAERRLQDRPVGYSAVRAMPVQSVGSKFSTNAAPLTVWTGNSRVADDSRSGTAPVTSSSASVNKSPIITSRRPVTDFAASHTEDSELSSPHLSSERPRILRTVLVGSTNDAGLRPKKPERMINLTPVTSQHPVTGVTTSHTEGPPFRSPLKSPEQILSVEYVSSSPDWDLPVGSDSSRCSTNMAPVKLRSSTGTSKMTEPVNSRAGPATANKTEWQLEAERRQAARKGVYIDPEKKHQSIGQKQPSDADGSSCTPAISKHLPSSLASESKTRSLTNNAVSTTAAFGIHLLRPAARPSTAGHGPTSDVPLSPVRATRLTPEQSRHSQSEVGVVQQQHRFLRKQSASIAYQ